MIKQEWRSPTVIAFANGILDEKAWDRFPILADAIEEAGCDNDELLRNLRDSSYDKDRFSVSAFMRLTTLIVALYQITGRRAGISIDSLLFHSMSYVDAVNFVAPTSPVTPET